MVSAIVKQRDMYRVLLAQASAGGRGGAAGADMAAMLSMSTPLQETGAGAASQAAKRARTSR